VTPDFSWSFDPGLVLALGTLLAIYLVRWRRARRETGPAAAGWWRLVSFVAGVLALVAALISPIDGLGEQLFSAHMLQHILALDVAPILLILGLTKVMLRPLTRRLVGVERALGPLGHPAFAVVVYVGVIWFWHVPVFYDAALTSAPVHALEHMSFTAAGFVFWWHLLAPIPRRHPMKGLGMLGYVSSTKVLIGVLAIVLAFSPELLYDGYAAQPDWFGITPIEDQHVGGAMMALQQAIVIIALALFEFPRMLERSERDQQRAERYGTP
jgi:putative membrane protein